MRIKDNEFGLAKVKRSHFKYNHWSNNFIGKCVRIINGNNGILAEVYNKFCGKIDKNIIIIKYPTNIPKKIQKEINIEIKICDKFGLISEKSKKLLKRKYNLVFNEINFV
jgi:hypothetical protein